MKLSANDLRIQGAETHDPYCSAIIDCDSNIDNVGTYSIRIRPTLGAFYLCKTKDGEHWVVGVPSQQWRNDLENAGYEVLMLIPSLDNKTMATT